MKKKTYEEYSIELSIKNPNLDVVGEYVDAKTKIRHRCKKHNIVWEISPSNALKGQGCNYCRYEKIGDKLSKSHEQYVIEAAGKNPHVIVLEKYINATTPILHKCVYCGKRWHICPSDVLAGKGCRECSCKRSGLYRRKSHQQYINDLAAVNSDIEPIEEYINTDTAILHRCKICEHMWSIKPNHTLSGHGCPLCGFKYNADLRRKSHDEYVQELSIVNQDIEVVEEYVNFNTRILHKCKACGHIWPIDPSHALRGQGCPICNQSHGERMVSQLLNAQHIEYVSQHIFNDCRDKQPLPFDFYLPKLNVAIEYQGQQHYEPVEFFGGQEYLEYVQYHDQIKSDYCAKNNIRLICVPYWEDVTEYLNRFLLI